MTTSSQIAMAFCPDCEEQVHLGTQPRLGQKVTCPDCWADLEVIRLKPLKLSWDTDYWDTDYLEENRDMKDWQRYNRIQQSLI
jgi:lysine biosynthesis protein LysW